MNELSGNVLTFDLLSDFLDYVLSRLDICVKSLSVAAEYIRGKAVKATMWASCVNIDCIVAVFFGFSFWNINWFTHFSPPSPSHSCWL